MVRWILYWLFPKLAYSGRMCRTKSDPISGKLTTVIYSPYSEHEYRSSDGKLLVRFVTTEGFERIPPDDELNHASKSSLRRLWRNEMFPMVSEIYFINTSQETIRVKPLELATLGDRATFDAFYELAPRQFAVSPPLVSLVLAGGYSRSIDFFLRFEYEKEPITVDATAVRLSMEELNAKYGGGAQAA